MRTGGWFLTYTGRQFWITDPHPDDVDVLDIAHALSNYCRFGGHSRQFYSVAQHCVHVVQRLQELCPKNPLLQMHGLLHDASEAYAGDVVRPLKQSVPEYGVYEARLMDTVYRALGLTFPTVMDHAYVKQADNELLLAERRDLVNHRDIPWSIPGEPWEFPIHPWSPDRAEQAFLNQFYSLGQKVELTR